MPTLIDPQKIYPKRMGIYRGALLIQYYNLQKDCFKKHVIPFDRASNADKNVENILKNPKHAIFLKKVAPHHLKNIIMSELGHHPNLLPADINERSLQQRSNDRNSMHYQQQKQGLSNKFESNISGNYSNNSKIGNQKSISMLSQSQNNNNKLSVNNNNVEESYGYSMNFDDQLNISTSIRQKQNAKKQQKNQENQYDQYFEDFQPEEVQEVQPLIPQPKPDPQETKVKKQKKQKKQKAEQLDEFDFLDDEPKKKKKKSKSKQKKKKKDKQPKQTPDTSKNVSSKEEDVPIQQQFDFL